MTDLSDPSKRLAQILKRAVTEQVSPLGFRKRSKRYVSDVGQLALLVEVSRSRFSDDGEISFTVDGGVYVPSVVQTYCLRAEPRTPGLVDCALSVRIGLLSPPRLDKWWRVSATDARASDVDSEIVADIGDRVANQLLPFLTGFGCEKDVAEYLASVADRDEVLVNPRSSAQRHAYAAIIFGLIGDRHAMSRELRSARVAAARSPIEGVVEALAARLDNSA